MGLFKKLKKLTWKKAAKIAAKVAPVAVAVIPGVGPVVAAGVAAAGNLAGKAKKLLTTAGEVGEVLGTGPPQMGIPTGERTYRDRSHLYDKPNKTNWLLWLGLGAAAFFLVPQLRRMLR